MEDKILNLFKLQYSWYEGEHQITVLATPKEQEEIEKDLKEAASSITTNAAKEKEAVYKPDVYQKIIGILKQKGYLECSFLLDSDYYVEDDEFDEDTKLPKYSIGYRKEKIEWKRLR